MQYDGMGEWRNFETFEIVKMNEELCFPRSKNCNLLRIKTRKILFIDIVVFPLFESRAGLREMGLSFYEQHVSLAWQWLMKFSSV